MSDRVRSLAPNPFDELYVVSDLQLGGDARHAQFDEGTAFAAFVGHVRTRPTGVRAGLVLNGDTVDFRGEEPDAELEGTRAADVLERALLRPAFAPVVEALRGLVHTRDRRLVIVMGDRDPELAWPEVRQRFTAVLCADDRLAARRLSFSVDDVGLHAQVGSARVLCVHGHQVDPRNQLDRQGLLQLLTYAEATSSPLLEFASEELRPPRLRPTSGRRIERALAPVFSQYPWLRLTSDLHPGVLAQLLIHLVRGEVLRVLPRILWATFVERKTERRLASRARWRPADSPAAVRIGAPRVNAQGSPTYPGRTVVGDDPFIAVRLMGEMLLPSRPSGQILRALRSRPPLPEFEERGGSQFTDLDEAVSDDVDFIVAGHTYLAASLRRRSGGYYLNPGTWTRRIRPAPELLSSPEAFAPAFDALMAGDNSALDRVPGLVTSRRMYAAIRRQGSDVEGTLLEWGPASEAALRGAGGGP